MCTYRYVYTGNPNGFGMTYLISGMTTETLDVQGPKS